MMRISVVFPAPLGPSRPNIPPLGTLTLTLSSATFLLPKFLQTFLHSIIFSLIYLKSCLSIQRAVRPEWLPRHLLLCLCSHIHKEGRSPPSPCGPGSWPRQCHIPSKSKGSRLAGAAATAVLSGYRFFSFNAAYFRILAKWV